MFLSICLSAGPCVEYFAVRVAAHLQLLGLHCTCNKSWKDPETTDYTRCVRGDLNTSTDLGFRQERIAKLCERTHRGDFGCSFQHKDVEAFLTACDGTSETTETGSNDDDFHDRSCRSCPDLICSEP